MVLLMDKDKKNAIIQEFVAFVEGRMPFDEFQRNYEANPGYKKLLDDKKPGKKYSAWRNRTINESMALYNWLTTDGKLVVHRSIMFFLQYYKIPVNPTQKYQNEAQYLVDIQPSYTDIEDEDFLNAIIASAPGGLTKSEKKKWLKEKIKSLFKYDKRPPRWIQGPEWPITNGKPLVFKGQTKEIPGEIEEIWYTFYDPETKEETVISQFY